MEKRRSSCNNRRNSKAGSTGVVKASTKGETWHCLFSLCNVFQKTIQESLNSESSDRNHSVPRDATSCDSWQFCIADSQVAMEISNIECRPNCTTLLLWDLPLRKFNGVWKFENTSVQHFYEYKNFCNCSDCLQAFVKEGRRKTKNR